MKKIKIAYILKEMPISGIGEVVMNYCRNIDLDIFEITIFAGEPIDEKYRIECEEVGIIIKKMPPKRGKNPICYYIFLLKNLTKNNFDIVHVHGNSRTIAIELFIAWLRGIKVRIAHSHNTTCDNKFIHIIFKPIFNAMCTNRLACGIDAGKWMFEKKSFEVVNNGINCTRFKFNEQYRKECRRKLNIEENYVIGHIGMYNEQKNHMFLIDVFEHIAKKNEKAVLLLIGDGPKKVEINKRIEESMYKDRIIQYGLSDQVYKLYNAMDVFVLPSKFEGLPVVLIESQVNGLNSVVSDVITDEACITNNVNKLSLNENKINWVNKILELKNKRSLIDYDSVKNFDIAENIKKLEKIYKNEVEK